MAKVEIRASVRIDEADYAKIVAFAETPHAAPELKNLSKLMETGIEANISLILGQIAQIEAQASTKAKVELFGPGGAPILSTGGEGDGKAQA